MPRLTRRATISSLGALGLAATAAPLIGCSDDGAADGLDLSLLPPLPQGLPEYAYDGAPGPATLFAHGVASGDPLPNAVVIWTRVSPVAAGALDVFYEVALDEGFRHRVAAGTIGTSADRDYTVNVDVTNLIWGRRYWYRFHALGRTSTVGRTLLAPAASSTQRLRLGACSCSNFANGYFHAYRWLAARKDLDLVLHLGDYIYEYGDGEYGTMRPCEPAGELLALDDYRRRHAQYKSDPDLQLLHATHPLVAIWDDHEVADNSWQGGAVNHQDDEGDWQTRKAAGTQAYFEWLPIREGADRVVYRALRYGALLDVVLLDARLQRDEPVDDVADDTDARQMLGAAQEAWLADELAAGPGRWTLVGQQVMLAQFQLGGSPFNYDQWDGYPAARRRLLEQFAAAKSGNVVVVTGDIHSAWANEVAADPFAAGFDRTRDNVAVEFITPAVSSPALPIALGPALQTENHHVRYADFTYNGYCVLDVTPERIQCDFYRVDGIGADDGLENWETGWTVAYGQHVLNAAPAAAVIDPG